MLPAEEALVLPEAFIIGKQLLLSLALSAFSGFQEVVDRPVKDASEDQGMVGKNGNLHQMPESVLQWTNKIILDLNIGKGNHTRS